MEELDDLNARALDILRRADDILTARAVETNEIAEIEEIRNLQTTLQETADRIVIEMQNAPSPSQSVCEELSEQLKVVQNRLLGHVEHGRGSAGIRKIAQVSDALSSLQSEFTFLAGPNGPGGGNPTGGPSGGGGVL